jgi:hypothetical protein
VNNIFLREADRSVREYGFNRDKTETGTNDFAWAVTCRCAVDAAESGESGWRGLIGG